MKSAMNLTVRCVFAAERATVELSPCFSGPGSLRFRTNAQRRTAWFAEKAVIDTAGGH
jgi:hypothetical protein